MSLARKYLAFDIETAKEIQGAVFDWKPHRPLGISCIASQTNACENPRVWLSRMPGDTPAAQMSRADVASFIDYLENASLDGFELLSWNGLSFDFDILAEESGRVDTCKKLALGHVDMMFHILCNKGFPVALASAAAGLGLPGKLAGVAGVDAPGLWAQGEYDTVTQYVAQDVRTTLAIAGEAEKRRSFAWKTRRGTISTMPLPQGWLRVESALQLPLPDTTWMTDPPDRNSFTTWLA